MLEIRDLTCDFGQFRLDRISLDVDSSSYQVLAGPSGAGKTLLLETIAGLHPLVSGTIRLEGQEISHLPPENRFIAMVYQDPHLFPHMTVEANVLYGMRFLSRESQKKAFQTLEQLTKILDLGGLMHRQFPAELSGGEKHKVALARALVTQPRLLLLDEPMASLDYSTRETVYELLARIHREFSIPILHVTHDHSEIWALGDTVTIIRDGRIEQRDSRQRVFERPSSPFVARFLGAENILDVTFEPAGDGEHWVTCGDTRLLRIPTGLCSLDHAHLIVRPENVTLRKGRGPGGTSGKIVETTARGTLVRIQVAVAKTTLVALVSRSDEVARLGVDEEVTVSLAFERSHFLPREAQ